MALDGIFLRHIKNEIEQTALNARVSRIYQPNRDELVFVMRTFGGEKKLLISSRANSARINFCEKAPENPAQPPMFCMLLRKRIGSGKLVSVRQNECDRVLMLDFECVNELGDVEIITVVCEIMGMYSNVIIVDSRGVIIDSLKRVDLTMSGKRLVLPNIKYELPVRQNKLNILACSAEQAARRVKESTEEVSLSKALIETLQGVSPIVCREIEYKVMQGASCRLEGVLYDRLVSQLEKLKTIAGSCGGTACAVYREDGKPMDFSFIPICQYGNFVKTESFDDFSSLLDNYYEERDKRERMKVKSRGIIKLLNNRRERVARRINKQKAELKRCANREQLRINGDLLQANLYRISRGAESAEVENFYSDNCETIRIKLNPAISPAANAQKYYKDYRKAKNAEIVLARQIENGKAELEYTESVLDTVNRAENEKELAQIREELIEQGYIKQSKKKPKSQPPLPPLRFESSDGFTILVGRNNRQNDKLTLKTASKNDMWLHTKDIHGSHAVIVSDGRKISETAIYEAARIAAYHSKARNSGSVAVDYTAVRYVSKPGGAKPGMVIYKNNKTICVTPYNGVEKAAQPEQ